MVQKQSYSERSPAHAEEAYVPTEDDSGPVSQGEFKLPRALLLWDQYGVAGRAPRGELDSQPTPIVHRGAFAGYAEDVRASSDAFDEDPTVAMAVVPHAAY